MPIDSALKQLLGRLPRSVRQRLEGQSATPAQVEQAVRLVSQDSGKNPAAVRALFRQLAGVSSEEWTGTANKARFQPEAHLPLSRLASFELGDAPPKKALLDGAKLLAARLLSGGDSQRFLTPAGPALQRLLEATASGKKLDRGSLEALAFTEALIDPISSLAEKVKGRAPPWAKAAPKLCAQLREQLQALRGQLDSPHLLATIDFLEAAMTASTPKDFARLEELAGRQNALARSSKDPVKVLSCFFYEESKATWPALYLIQDPPLESASPGGESLDLSVERLASFFAKLSPDKPKPGLLYTDNLLCVPPEGDATAFALHDQAAVVFQSHDPKEAAFNRKVCALVGIEPRVAKELGQRYLVGHEFGHKYDPLNLPPITAELFADVASFVSTNALLEGSASPELRVKAFVAFMLANYGPLSAEPVAPADEPYCHSANRLLLTLVEKGVLQLDPKGKPPCRVSVTEKSYRQLVAQMRESFEALRSGRCPPEMAKPVNHPALRRLQEQVASLRRESLG